MKKNKSELSLKTTICLLGLALVISVFPALALMVLWNCVAVGFGLPSIKFLTAWILSLLIRIIIDTLKK